MIKDEIVTYLEMTSPERLVAGRAAPASIEWRCHDVVSLQLVRDTYAQIGTPYNWIGRIRWSNERWREWLSRPGLTTWLPYVNGEVAGMVELEIQPGGDVEIVVFGLVPKFVGKGFGGRVLTDGIRLAWEAERGDGETTRRVWLHTSSCDHPNAKPNYEARGFRVFKTEHKRREIPDVITTS